MKLLVLLAFLLFISCNTEEKIPKPIEPRPSTPTIPTQPSEVVLGKKVTLYSTYYFIPQFNSSSSGYPIRGIDADRLSKNLTLDQWCFGGLQGTVKVDDTVYGYTGKTSSKRVPCERSFLRSASFARATGGVKFRVDRHKFGTGNKRNALIPYKSIACDQSIYKYGQIFFIPSAKGAILPDSSIHDGVFTCGDVGGAIKGNHIDTFIGFVDMRDKDFKLRYSIAFKTMPKAFQSYIKSKPSGSFTAYLIVE